MNNIMNNFLTLKHNKTPDVTRQKSHDNDTQDRTISLTESKHVLEMYIVK